MRHRCHISCEIHDHHLNDAMRLHQAMLSNAALDIGSINLADMDPDEIQVSSWLFHQSLFHQVLVQKDLNPPFSFPPPSTLNSY